MAVSRTGGAGGAHEAKPRTRSNTLRQAASAVFALTAIVPLLFLVWTVHYIGQLSKFQAQVGLFLSLVMALLGFWVFRKLMGRMSDLIQALSRVVELRERSGSLPAAEPAPPGAAEHAGVTAAPDASATLASRPARVLDSAAAVAQWMGRQKAAEPHGVPGLGAIREVHDLSRAMGVLWQAEAAGYKGRRVVVSVLSSPRPIIGTLIALTDDGLLVQTDGSERVPVKFNRISAIDAEE